MGKRWNRPKRGKTVVARPKRGTGRWPNGGNGEKRPEREKPLERENPAERNGGTSRKRGKTVAAWPETWENGGRMAEVE